MILGDGFTLGRLITRNADYQQWPATGAQPLHWVKYSQTSHYDQTGLVAHSGSPAALILCFSSTTLNVAAQLYLAAGNGSTLNALADDSSLYDGRLHRLHWGGWLLRYPSNSLGYLRSGLVMHGNSQENGPYFAANDEWQHFEVSHIFQGSNYMYGRLMRANSSIDLTFYTAGFYTLLDQMSLQVSWGAELAAKLEAWDHEGQIGRVRHVRRDTNVLRLPVEAITRTQRKDLEDWQRKSAPLALRFSATSASAPIYTVNIMGGDSGVALSEGPDGLFQGVLTLEER